MADLTFISDLHLGPAAAGVEPHFLALLRELAARHRNGREQHLFVLGDLFSFWVERPGLVRRLHGGALEALAQCVRSGCRVTVLDGNRDFGYGSVIREATRVEVAGESAVVEHGGQRTLAIHGDQLITGDWRYRVFKNLVRSLPARVAAKSLPEGLLLWAIRRLEGISRRENRVKRPEIMALDEAEAARLLRGAGAALLVCGHTHEPREAKLDGGGKLFVLGKWTAEGGLLLDWPEGGEPRLTHFAARG